MLKKKKKKKLIWHTRASDASPLSKVAGMTGQAFAMRIRVCTVNPKRSAGTRLTVEKLQLGVITT